MSISFPFFFFVVQTDRDGWATRRSADWDQASADLQGEINLSETSGSYADTHTSMLAYLYINGL